MNPSRRNLLAGISALALAPILVACGDDEGSSGSGSGTGGSGSGSGSSEPPATEESAFPVTIAHKFGETTLEKAPTRVVCVGLTEQDALLALGIVPVAVTKWFGDAPGFIFSWAVDKLGDAELPEVLSDANGVQVEKIAALAPDLIIGQYAGLQEQDYELLSKIAPTVAQPKEYADYGAPWDEMALNIGKAVGQPDEMQAIVDDVKKQITDQAAAHPEFQGRTAMCVTPYEGLFVYGPEDPRSRMLVDLGFAFPTEVFGGKQEEFGSSLSSERTSDLDQVDVTVWLDLETDQAVKEVYEKTTSFAEGRFFDISEQNGDYYIAHSFVTPLSIPYLLERYVPQLAAAVDADPATTPPPVTD
jgi:iron complex transport system substrate-binding protein